MRGTVRNSSWMKNYNTAKRLWKVNDSSGRGISSQCNDILAGLGACG